MAEWKVEGPGDVPAPGAAVLSCFPSAGLAATVAGHYILRTLKLPRIGTITAPELPALAVVQGGRVNPPVRVHGRKDLALILSEFPPPPSLVTPIAKTILDGSARIGAGRIIGLEGVISPPAEDAEEASPAADEDVWWAGSAEEGRLPSDLKTAGVRPLVDGVIGGVSGALLLESLSRGTSVGALLVSARDVGYPDHRAAAKLIEVLDKVLPHLEIDTRPLRTQAELIERALRSAMKARGAPEAAGSRAGELPIYQ